MIDLIEFSNNFKDNQNVVKVKSLNLVCLIEDRPPFDIWVIGVDQLSIVEFGISKTNRSKSMIKHSKQSVSDYVNLKENSPSKS